MDSNVGVDVDSVVDIQTHDLRYWDKSIIPLKKEGVYSKFDAEPTL